MEVHWEKHLSISNMNEYIFLFLKQESLITNYIQDQEQTATCRPATETLLNNCRHIFFSFITCHSSQATSPGTVLCRPLSVFF